MSDPNRPDDEETPETAPEDVVRADTGTDDETGGDTDERPLDVGAPRDHSDTPDPEDDEDDWPEEPAGPRKPAKPGPADAVSGALAGLLPESMGPYLQLSRFDRPAGFWLLGLPCFIGLAFARVDEGWRFIDIWWLLLFAIGAVAMRGAGCTWNDIQDRKIDASVERTKGRPLPSGAVTVGQAWMWLAIQLVVGFLVWVCLPTDAKIVAFLVIPMVAAYPFMKRITWWPQAWLGLTFNWGVLVAAATAGNVTLLSVLLYLGLALWTVGYDTIYAATDREDDALIGVKSTARLFEGQTGLAIFCFYLAAAAVVGLAAWIAGAGRIGALAVLGFFLHGLWQVVRMKRSKEADALPIFRSNVWAGGILFVGFALSAMFAYGKPGADDAPREAASRAAPATVEPAQPRVYDATQERLRARRPATQGWWAMTLARQNSAEPAETPERQLPPSVIQPTPPTTDNDAAEDTAEDNEEGGLFSNFYRPDRDPPPESTDPE